jgi:hypothetical protein
MREQFDPPTDPTKYDWYVDCSAREARAAAEVLERKSPTTTDYLVTLSDTVTEWVSQKSRRLWVSQWALKVLLGEMGGEDDAPHLSFQKVMKGDSPVTKSYADEMMGQHPAFIKQVALQVVDYLKETDSLPPIRLAPPPKLRILQREYEVALEAIEEADRNYQEIDEQESAAFECAKRYIAQLEETLDRIKMHADRWSKSTLPIQRGRAAEIINGTFEGLY